MGACISRFAYEDAGRACLRITFAHLPFRGKNVRVSLSTSSMSNMKAIYLNRLQITHVCTYIYSIQATDILMFVYTGCAVAQA